ncbi:GNAT family N-acetyltransferase [Fusibacter sp. JL298sf-3]
MNCRTIETHRLILKVLKPCDGARICRFYEENAAFLEPYEALKSPAFYSDSYQSDVLKVEERAFLKGQMVRYWFFLKSDRAFETPIGSVALTNVVRGVLQSCFIGYKTDWRHVNCGYMTEAIEAVIPVAFDAFGLHRLEASVMPRNKASLRVLEKLGFEAEGLSKRYLKINGVWEDHIRLAKLNDSLK